MTLGESRRATTIRVPLHILGLRRAKALEDVNKSRTTQKPRNPQEKNA
jgi:hypothetical protein